MKICSKCGVPKSESEFLVRSDTGRLRNDCSTCKTEYDRLHRIRNLEEKRDYDRKRDKEARALATRERRKKFPEAIREADRNRRNTPEARAKKRQRYQEDPSYRLKITLRQRQHNALCGAKKSARTFELLGCPAIWLEVHIESLFKSGMTWKNYGSVWEVDHIKPCAAFNLSNPEHQKACFHWTNLQPLFTGENRRKSDKYEQ